jgi:hypothetical protein
MKKFYLLFFAFLSLVKLSYTQEITGGVPFQINVGADVMSRYIWRGSDYGNSPSVQPTLSFDIGNFEIGYWGAISITSNYLESDLYLKYTIKGFSFGVTDYFIPAMVMNSPYNDTRYTIYKNTNKINFDTVHGITINRFTTHALEGFVQYKGPEKFPISILIGTYFYGNDKLAIDTVFTKTNKILSVNFKNQYSTYIELGYSFTVKGYNFDVFAGMSPMKSMYTTPLYTKGFAFVNTGLTGYRKIKISDKFDLPIKASAIFNPQTSSIFLVFGVTL